jgi:predicted dienelactone hydrolase
LGAIAGVVLVGGVVGSIVALTAGSGVSSASATLHELSGVASSGLTQRRARQTQQRSPGSGRAATERLAATVAVGLRVFTFVDRYRKVRFLNGSVEPRTLVTEVRYPAVGPAGANDLRNAAPLRGPGPYPLVVFGHGFAVTPDVYAGLLDAWARAGYVVASPVFQLGSPLAPGGPNEADLINWPTDMSFVISRMLDENTRGAGPLSGLIDRSRIAVSGQSDGGDTALAIAFDPALRDRRVDAALILSGAEIPQLGPFAFPAHGPPLLATQGSADTINPPSATQTFFAAAPRPKFLLTLIGATHLPPYTTAQPYLGIVEHVSIAFLDRYLKDQAPALRTILTAGSVAGVTALQADP